MEAIKKSGISYALETFKAMGLEPKVKRYYKSGSIAVVCKIHTAGMCYEGSISFGGEGEVYACVLLESQFSVDVPWLPVYVGRNVAIAVSKLKSLFEVYKKVVNI